MAKLNVPIPQDKIEECFVWRDWFQKLSNKVFGNMADQNSNDVSITGGNIQVDSLAVTGGKDGQLLIGRTSDHKFTPAYLTAGLGVSIATGPSTVIISQASGSTTTKYYGAFSDYNNQTAAAATTTAITLGTTDLSNGVSRGSPTSRIVIAHAGIYNFQLSIEFQNTSSQIDDVTVWLRQNGTDVVGSAGLVGVSNKHGAIHGHVIASWNYLVQAATNDYLELYWTTDSGASSIVTLPASAVAPLHPSAASVIVTVQQI